MAVMDFAEVTEGLSPIFKPGPGDIRVTYEAMDRAISLMDGWPPYFSVLPRRGDMVESTTGRRLEIKRVVHCIENNATMVRVVLGIPSEVTATGGGGGAAVEMEPE